MTANTKTPAGWGPRAGIIRPGSDPQKYMNLARIDVATGELRVLYSQPQASSGSALVTAGDLVFWGDQNRRFRAFDADDGKVLWEAVVAGRVVNSTISYAVSGKQYVMVFPLGLTKDKMPPAVRRHNSIFAYTIGIVRVSRWSAAVSGLEYRK
jgi:outer membrane protein assembly factor BamB